MKTKDKKNKNGNAKRLGPIIEIMLFALISSVLALVFNLIGTNGYITEAKTFETTLIIVNNIFSKAGIKYILNDSLSNFQALAPLVMLIMSLIAVSILEASGLLKQLFSPLKNIKFRYITMGVIFVGIISTIIGDYSYTVLLPIAGILYKYIGKSSTLGVLTMFIAITIGYGTGLMYNYQAYELVKITELSAQSIITDYSYKLSSNIFVLLASTIILTIVGTLILEKFAKKFTRNEDEDNLNTSKKASRITLIAFIIMLAIVIYSIIPGLPLSGILLDRNETTYIAKLFGSSSPLNQGLMFMIIGILMICGLIYGTVSRNIKNSGDYSKALSKTFEGTGYVFVLLFFTSILYEIIDWTKIYEVISVNIIDFIGTSQITGSLLVILVFLIIVFMSIFIPSTITKWQLAAPIFVPLLIRANISPSFTQTIFVAADSVGKLFSPIYLYLIITIGFMYKYDKDTDTNILGTMKKLMPSILFLSLTWVVIIVVWYLIGLPIGINSNITL